MPPIGAHSICGRWKYSLTKPFPLFSCTRCACAVGGTSATTTASCSTLLSCHTSSCSTCAAAAKVSCWTASCRQYISPPWPAFPCCTPTFCTCQYFSFPPCCCLHQSSLQRSLHLDGVPPSCFARHFWLVRHTTIFSFFYWLDFVSLPLCSPDSLTSILFTLCSLFLK